MASPELQELATNRWLERANLAQQKRGKGLQQIQGRNVREPFPAGSFERLKNYQLWEEILPYITDSQDKTKLHGVCDTFQTILEGWKEETTLIGALKVLKDKQFIGRKFQQNDGIDTNAFRKFMTDDVLKLRLISKDWKDAAELVFMNDFDEDCDWHLHFQDKLGYTFTEWKWIPNVLSFSMDYGEEGNPLPFSGTQLEQVDKAMSVLEKSSPQSISALTSILHIDDSGWKDFEAFAEKLNQFLDTYGTYVQGLLIKCNDQHPKICRYLRLLSIVNRLPNLKAVVINFSSKTESQNELTLMEIIEKSPFPTIPSLTLLSFDDFAEKSLTFEILGKNLNLKSLKLPNDLRDLDGTMLETLEKLKFLEDYVAYDNLLRSGFLANVNWPLKKIEIHESVQNVMHQYVPILNRFGNTLEHLKLNYFVPRSNHRRMILPKLKTLELFVLKDCKTLDFLLPLKSLEDLSIGELKANSPDVWKTVVEATRYPDIVKRNPLRIWRHFPNLKRVQLRSIRMPGDFLFVKNERGDYIFRQSELL